MEFRNAELEYGSREDVSKILEANGVAGAELRCANPTLSGKVIRAVACTTTLSDTDVAALSKTVPLAPSAPGAAADGSCEKTSGFASTDFGVTVLRGKNDKVPNGVGDVEVHLVRPSGRACIEIRYPWG